MRDRPDIPCPGAHALTCEALVGDLRALGVRQGQTLLVHASLRSIGHVNGGAATVVAALREAVSESGTVVVPTSTEENSNTSRAHMARVAGMSAAEIREYRDRMPAFDKASTPATGAGRIAEALRTTPDAVRSDHPQSSFAAIGPEAAELMTGHLLTCHLGEHSPLGKLYERDALILLLGVGYEACSALHLAEYRYTANPPMREYACVVTTDGRRHWTTYRDVVLDDYEFSQIGEDADSTVTRCRGYVGDALCRLMPMRETVDFATAWMSRHRR